MPDDTPTREPDYRMSLAAERTYLAHVRTGLALVAAGVAAAGAFPDAGGQTVRTVLGIGLIGVGAILLAVARPRWAAIERSMRAGTPLPRSRVVDTLSWLVLAGALGAVVVVLLL